MDMEALDGVEVKGGLKELNDVLFFDIIGELGIPCFWNHRETIFHLSYLLTLFSLVASVFSIFSIAPNEDVTLATNWSFGESSKSRMWVGLSGSFWETIVGATTQTAYITWTDTACSDTIDNPYCDNCSTGGRAAAFLVLMSCTTRVPSMMLLKARMNPISDIPLIKFLGMVSEGLASVCLFGAMFIWREYCHVQLPSPSVMNYSYGSGFMMVSAGFCVTFLLFVIHTLMPTEDPYDDESLLDEHLPQWCSSKSRASKQMNKNKTKSSQVQPGGANYVVKDGKKRRRRRRKKPAGTGNTVVAPGPGNDVVSEQMEKRSGTTVKDIEMG